MTDTFVPDEHHIVRLCGASHLRSDGVVSYTAFRPRPGEAYLSVNWLEFLDLADEAAALMEVRRMLATKRKIGSTACLARLNVGDAKAMVRGASGGRLTISIKHEPEPIDPSHSGIYGVPEDSTDIQDALAMAVQQLTRARA
jgi:hypothetical protein